MSSEVLSTYLEQELALLKEKGLYNTIDILEGANGAIIEVAGKNLINLASNNYLGFAD
ncbi:Putative pyridoxal phosphate-dependent acyltransferase [Enterococcus hirae]|nr:Putative pyridoxal phosphate-dependent acyltransferase [Enterococcus hirae]